MSSIKNSGSFLEDSNQTPLVAKEGKFQGFDFLRAFFSVAIVALKTHFLSIPKLLGAHTLTYILYATVASVAVPVFLQISLFLFHSKSKNLNLSYFLKKRLPKLLSLYAFWVGLITLFDILLGGFDTLRQATSSPRAFIEFIISGNTTPYFFFFALIFTTIIAELLIVLFSKFRQTSTKILISYVLLFISCACIFLLSSVESLIEFVGIQSSILKTLNNIAHWDYNPINFLPYVFTAAITAQEYNAGKLSEMSQPLRLKLYVMASMIVCFFILEWGLTERRLLIQLDDGFLNHYMRLSLVFGSWLLLYWAILSRKSVPQLISFLSKCSLGIYGFHVFFTFRRSVPFGEISVIGGFFQSIENFLQPAPVLGITLFFIGTLTASILLTLISKRSKYLKGFI